jgi:MoxR-like ATPase
MKQYSQSVNIELEKVFSTNEILEVKKQIEEITVSENIFNYVVDIVFLTRDVKFTEKYLAI